MKRNFAIRILFWLLITTNAFAQVVEIPDPNLRSVIREELELTANQPITQKEMLRLTHWRATDIDIIDLTGIKSAINSESLDLGGNNIRDIRPLAHLVNLTKLSLWSNKVEDIAPLANLTHLISLELSYNNIVDLSPLANLTNLRRLSMDDNLATDFSPLRHLNLTLFEHDQVCNIAPQPPPTRERIENRSFPSVFQDWDDVIGRHPRWVPRTRLSDLHWGQFFWLTTNWNRTPTEPTEGLATSVTVRDAHEVREQWLSQAPNHVFFAHILLHVQSLKAFSPQSEFWLRDASDQIVRNQGNAEYYINFVKPRAQALLINRIVAIARCGFYDGVFLDGFNSNGTGFVGRHLYPYSDEEIIQAYLNIFQSVRSQVREDFLIIINTNHTKPTRFAEHVNGTFMETGKDSPNGYSRPWLMRIEETLSWAEENLREPRINCLQGEGMSIEPPDGPNNQRWMRLFTTLGLTHSDGYIQYAMEHSSAHLWYSLWDVHLGQPVSLKNQRHKNIDGLFIREFTNGWAVYNRSGESQTISLSQYCKGVASDKQDVTHLLPDLDGEIYLRIGKPFDLNRDGTVNILDLIIVSQGFGTTKGDINGDGTTDILDLTLVAQQFSK